MAKKRERKTEKAKKKEARPRPLRWVLRQFRRVIVLAIALVVLAVLFFWVINPPVTPYMLSERSRLGDLDHEWVPLEAIAPVMARSVVAAEDANFCLHWGFDMAAIRDALAQGAARGASTITQQTVKNVYLWHGRSWARKALEALMTPLVELIWSKRRIIEVYLNVAEFGEGVFGIEAAARHYFDKGPDKLSTEEAALLAAILPDPKRRSASRPGPATRARAVQVRDGAATILRDGRAACFED